MWMVSWPLSTKCNNPKLNSVAEQCDCSFNEITGTQSPVPRVERKLVLNLLNIRDQDFSLFVVDILGVGFAPVDFVSSLT